MQVKLTLLHNVPQSAGIAVAAVLGSLLACTGTRQKTTATATATPVTVSPRVVLGDASAADAPPVVQLAAPRLRTNTRPLPADIAQYRSVSQVQLAPDGARVVYSLRTPSYDPDARQSDDDHSGGWSVTNQLYMVERQSGATRQLTYGQEAPYQPRWSPDGEYLAFLRHGEDGPALHILPMRGGEARVIDLGALHPQQYRWSPDSQALAFTSLPEPSDAEKEQRWRSGGAENFDREWRNADLYTIDLSGRAQPRRVTQGAEHIHDFEWSPDGRQFAAAVAASSDPYHAWGYLRLSIIAADSGAVVRVLESQPADIATIAWSPDGRYLAYERGDKTLSLHNALRVHDMTGQTTRDVADGLDPTLAGFVWSADSRSIVANVLEGTGSTLYRLPATRGRPAVLGKPEQVIHPGTLTVDRSGRYIAAVGSSTTQPPAPMLLDVRRKNWRPLVISNPQVSEWTLAKSEVIRWQNADGTTIEGLLYVTPHAQAGQPAPLMVLPHGGPDGITTRNFNIWAHYFAARGYSVLMPNYRGGFGRGYKFYAANRGRLGDIEFADIEPGVDHLIAAGRADGARLFYGGWSWGGFITTWTITKTSRYKAAVVGAGVIDVVTQYVTSDINHGYAAEWEFQGNPWRQPDNFKRANPARHLADIRTPTLIIHGRDDRRVSFINGMILYRALSDLGIENKLLAYPREHHGFSEPAHVVHMLEQWAHWYDSHL